MRHVRDAVDAPAYPREASPAGRTSAILEGIVASPPIPAVPDTVPEGAPLDEPAAHPDAEGRITAGKVVDAFGQRAFGALVVVFALPNVIPIPMPGVAGLLAVPLIFLNWQLLSARPRPWLPRFVRRQSLARTDFARLVGRMTPVLTRIERLARPRLLWLTEGTGERMIGLTGLLLSMVLMLPIPFGNWLPGVALTLLGLGLLERDGRLVTAGFAVAGFTAALFLGLGYGIATGGAAFVGRILG